MNVLRGTILWCFCAIAAAAQDGVWSANRMPGTNLLWTAEKSSQEVANVSGRVAALSNTVATLPAPTGVPIWYDSSDSNYFATAQGGTGLVWKVSNHTTNYYVILSSNFGILGQHPSFTSNAFPFAQSGSWYSGTPVGSYQAGIYYGSVGTALWGSTPNTLPISYPLKLLPVVGGGTGTATVHRVITNVTNLYTRIAYTNDLTNYATLDDYVAGTNLLHDQMIAISNNAAMMDARAVTNGGGAVLSTLKITGPVVSGASVGTSADYIAATARGASQWGIDGFGGATIGAYAVGAQQRGFCVSGPAGPWYIGPNAYGATQVGFSDEMNAGYVSATNLASGAFQLFDFSEFDVHQHALTTAGGGGSLMLGAGVSSNRHALVVGSGAVSHGDGSVTATGGFYGDGSGLYGLTASQISGLPTGAAADPALVPIISVSTGAVSSVNVSTTNCIYYIEASGATTVTNILPALNCTSNLTWTIRYRATTTNALDPVWDSRMQFAGGTPYMTCTGLLEIVCSSPCGTVIQARQTWPSRYEWQLAPSFNGSALTWSALSGGSPVFSRTDVLTLSKATNLFASTVDLSYPIVMDLPLECNAGAGYSEPIALKIISVGYGPTDFSIFAVTNYTDTFVGTGLSMRNKRIYFDALGRRSHYTTVIEMITGTVGLNATFRCYTPSFRRAEENETAYYNAGGRDFR